MSFRSKYIPIEEACRRLGMDDRKDMILFCQRFMIPMTKIWGVQNPTISQIYWNEKLENMWTEKLTGRCGDLPVPGERCAVKDAAERMSMSSMAFVSWCRKHHVELGLDINDLQGYVPYVLWTSRMQAAYEKESA